MHLSMRRLLELYCVDLSSFKHVAFFTIWAKSTVPFTFSSLLSDLCTSVSGCRCGLGFNLNKSFGGLTDLAKKNARIGGFANPYSPPSLLL